MNFVHGKLTNISKPATGQHNPCRLCHAPLRRQIFDFGAMPVSNALVRPENLGKGEIFYPLQIMACETCSLVQLVNGPPAETHFHGDYVYFSSFSQSWLRHCADYAEAMAARFDLKPGDEVIEIASNDGGLLSFFKQRGLSVLGIEPSASVAQAARAKDIATDIRFFNLETARGLAAAGARPRLIVANNVLAHVPDLHDFVAGLALLLQGDAVLTAEVHYFRDLFEKGEFDSFYHEHYAYFTVRAAERIFTAHGLRLFDVERLATHGGSVRFYVCRREASWTAGKALKAALAEDKAFFDTALAGLTAFQDRIFSGCAALQTFLRQAKRDGKRVAGYGAPAKAATLLNAARVGRDLLPYTVDSNPRKQNCFLPGVHVPILAPEIIERERPDYILLLPWNLKHELSEQLAALRASGTKLVCAIPALEIF